MESRAYTQAYYIIDSLSEELKSKIPQRILKAIESQMDKTYEFYVDDDDLENIELLEDTEKILSVIYTDYLATDEERKIIKNKERLCWAEEENNKSQMYSSDIFKQKQDTYKSTKNLTVKKETWINKIINKLKIFFKKY